MEGEVPRHNPARVALYLDVENLVHDLRQQTDYGAAIERIAGVVRLAENMGTVVAKVACCDADLARILAFDLDELGIRTFTHPTGGQDAADRMLVDELTHGVPASADVVVIGSGDHFFAAVATRLRARHGAVVVVGLSGSVSWQLYRAAAAVITLFPSGEETAREGTAGPGEQTLSGRRSVA